MKQIIKECYLIAKNCNTPYTDLLDITPTEKTELLKLISEEAEKTVEAMEKFKSDRNQKPKNNRRR